MLIVGYAVDGRLGPAERGLSLALAPSIALAMIVGEAAFRRVPVAAFRAMVFATLLASGVALLVRG